MNLKGGYIIISLMSMVLDADSDYNNYITITDKEVLEQLLQLKDYVINPSKELKPIYLRFKDVDNIQHVKMCTLSRDSNILSIHNQDKDCVIDIVVEYGYDADTQEVYIESAMILFNTTIIQTAGQVIEELSQYAEEGTIDEALGLDSDGKIVKGAVEAGAKLIEIILDTPHTFDLNETTDIQLFDEQPTPPLQLPFSDYPQLNTNKHYLLIGVNANIGGPGGSISFTTRGRLIKDDTNLVISPLMGIAKLNVATFKTVTVTRLYLLEI